MYVLYILVDISAPRLESGIMPDKRRPRQHFIAFCSNFSWILISKARKLSGPWLRALGRSYLEAELERWPGVFDSEVLRPFLVSTCTSKL